MFKEKESSDGVGYEARNTDNGEDWRHFEGSASNQLIDYGRHFESLKECYDLFLKNLIVSDFNYERAYDTTKDLRGSSKVIRESSYTIFWSQGLKSPHSSLKFSLTREPLFVFLMSVSLVFESASYLAISTYADSAVGQKRIFIYYDPSYPNSWYDISDSWFIARYISYVLKQHGVSSEVVDAEALARIVEDLLNASDTIIIMAHDVAPWTIWNGSQNSPIESWIKAGGIITWSGDWEFYYIGYPDGSKAHFDGTESIVFRRSITSDTNVIVEPTELGFKILPSMDNFISLRPADASKLHGLQYEVYGERSVDEVTFYDPILIKLGDGALAKIAMTCLPGIDALMRGVLISEFVLNRV